MNSVEEPLVEPYGSFQGLLENGVLSIVDNRIPYDQYLVHTVNIL
jgi:hypothetical protein